ncbi:MAG: alanine--tRNA ligase-related protein [Candidatus Hodgkinia cicadicola]
MNIKEVVKTVDNKEEKIKTTKVVKLTKTVKAIKTKNPEKTGVLKEGKVKDVVSISKNKEVVNISKIKNSFENHCKLWGHLATEINSVNSNCLEIINNEMEQKQFFLEDMFKNNNQSSPLWGTQKYVIVDQKYNNIVVNKYNKYYLSLFEIMGVFSINYNIEYAIEFVWNFLLRLGFNTVNDLLITVHSMDSKTLEIWKTLTNNVVITYGEKNILKMTKNNNVYIGQCTEIYFVNGSEYWKIINIAFISHIKNDIKSIGKITNNIIIGIELEQILAVINKTFDVYYTDGISQIINEIWPPNINLTFSHREIIDHMRTSCLLISANIVPANTGAGSVLRKLVKRCLTELKLNGYKLGLFYNLIDSVIKNSLYIDPSLLTKRTKIISILRSETVLYFKNINNIISVLINCNNYCFEFFDIPQKLIEILKNERSIVRPTINYCTYDVDQIESMIVAVKNNMVILNKTNLYPLRGTQIGDIGIIAGFNFNIRIQRNKDKLDNYLNCHSTNNSSLLNNITGKYVHIFRNEHLSSISACSHTCLHLINGIYKTLIKDIKIICSKINYLGFIVEFNSKKITCNLLSSLNNIFLCSKYLDVISTSKYTKVNNKIQKIVIVKTNNNIKYVEECDGKHASITNLGFFSFNVSFVSKDKYILSGKLLAL